MMFICPTSLLPMFSSDFYRFFLLSLSLFASFSNLSFFPSLYSPHFSRSFSLAKEPALDSIEVIPFFSLKISLSSSPRCLLLSLASSTEFTTKPCPILPLLPSKRLFSTWPLPQNSRISNKRERLCIPFGII